MSASHSLTGTTLCSYCLLAERDFLVPYATRLRTVPFIFDQFIPALILSYLRSSMGQDRFSNLALLSIEREALSASTSKP